MQPAFPARQVANLMLTAALVWLHFAGGAGMLPITPGPIRVLVVYDTIEQPINSTNVIHYLRTHCIKEGNPPTAAFRQWNSAVDATNESDPFKKLFAMKREKGNWVLIQSQSGQTFSGPLPDSIDNQIALFTKWGGP